MSTNTLSINVKGMTCNHCKSAVEGMIVDVKGVMSAMVDLESGKAEVHIEPKSVTRKDIIAKVNTSESYKAS